MAQATESDGEPDAVMAKLLKLHERLEHIHTALLEGKLSEAGDIAERIGDDAERYNCGMCDRLALGLRGGVAFASAMPNEDRREDRIEAVLDEVGDQKQRIEWEIQTLNESEGDDGAA